MKLLHPQAPITGTPIFLYPLELQSFIDSRNGFIYLVCDDEACKGGPKGLPGQSYLSVSQQCILR